MTGYIPDPPPEGVDSTLTLAGSDLNDGSTYTLRYPVVIEPLAVSATINDNAADGSQTQDNVKTKVPALVSFPLLVRGASTATLNTAVAVLDALCRAGGALLFTKGGATILSCDCGASTPPTRIYTPEAATDFWMLLQVELVRMT